MSRTFATWQHLSESLRRGIPAMLLYVVHSRGSSPGRQGFAMSVDTLGAMQGSIGGGIMEHKLVQLARERLAQPSSTSSLHRQIHNKKAPPGPKRHDLLRRANRAALPCARPGR